AWYSKFSDRSPCARATAIASTAALRFGPSSSASSASSCSRSARVSCSPMNSVTAAAGAAAAPATAERGLLHRPVHGKGGELLRDVHCGAVGAGDLLVAPDELLEVRLAFHADVLVDRHTGILASGSSSDQTIQSIAPAAKPSPAGRIGWNHSTNRYVNGAMRGCGRHEKTLHHAAERTLAPRGTRTRLIASPSGTLCAAIASVIRTPRRVPPP